MKIIYSLRGIYLVVCLLLFAGNFTFAFSEQITYDAESVTPRAPEEALRYDGMWYAAHFNVSIEEAVYRLSLQSQIGELYAALMRQEKSTFAGLWITHLPEYKVHIAFTREGETTITPYLKNSALEALVVLESARFSYEELKNAQLTISHHLITELGIPANTSINQEENRIEILTIKPYQVGSVISFDDSSLQDMIDVIGVSELPTLELNDYAGLPQSQGTSGFIVYKSVDQSLKYHSTAAHVANVLYLYPGSSNKTRLPFHSSYYGGDFDFQLHRIPKRLTPKPWITDNINYDGTPYFREITNSLFSYFMPPGGQVCHYGASSGYSCGTIVATDACIVVNGTVGCPYIQVRDVQHAPGDSGGPWFLGSVAYGIHHGSTDQYTYFMPAEAYSWKGYNVYTIYMVP